MSHVFFLKLLNKLHFINCTRALQGHFFISDRHLKTTVYWLWNNILFLVLIFVQNFFPLHSDVFTRHNFWLLPSLSHLVSTLKLVKICEIKNNFRPHSFKHVENFLLHHFDVFLFDIISALIFLYSFLVWRGFQSLGLETCILFVTSYHKSMKSFNEIFVLKSTDLF